MRVLIIEDDRILCSILRRAFEEAGYAVETAVDGIRGDALAAEGGFDAILLDLNLPGMRGRDICKRLREANDHVPVLMATARDEVGDRIDGLDIGADDYVIKPYDIDELLARVRSVVRRAGMQRAAVYGAGTIAVDMRTRIATVAGSAITLTAREFDLLEYLIRHAGSALRRQRIEEAVWGTNFETSSNIVDVFIRRLRRKLGAPAADRIETLRGFGYRLNPGEEDRR